MGLFERLMRGSQKRTKEKKFQTFEAMFEDDPQMIAFAKAQWLVGKGNSAGAHGNLESAIADFEEAKAIDPTHIFAYIGIGTAHREAGKFAEALDVLGRGYDIALAAEGTNSRAALFDLCNAIIGVHIQAGSKSNVVEWATRAIAAAEEPERIEMHRIAAASGMNGSSDDEEMVETLKGLVEEYQVKAS